MRQRTDSYRITLVVQPGPMACGAAALSMVLTAFGVAQPLETLRRDLRESSAGTRASDIMRVAEAHGVRATTLEESEPKRLVSWPGPMILPWRENHYVVVGRRTLATFEIFDPVGFRVEAKLHQVRRSWHCVALAFGRPEDPVVTSGSLPKDHHA